MNNLTLNKPQIQIILDNLTKQEGGTNSLLELTLNAFMKAERNEFIQKATNQIKAMAFVK